MRYCFDIDGVICHTEGTDYRQARPNPAVIARINALHDAGHTIVLQTARGMGTLDGDLRRVYEVWYDVTRAQMKSFGVKFDELLLGKTHADVYIDDKGLNSERWLAGENPRIPDVPCEVVTARAKAAARATAPVQGGATPSLFDRVAS